MPEYVISLLNIQAADDLMADTAIYAIAAIAAIATAAAKAAAATAAAVATAAAMRQGLKERKERCLRLFIRQSSGWG